MTEERLAEIIINYLHDLHWDVYNDAALLCIECTDRDFRTAPISSTVFPAKAISRKIFNSCAIHICLNYRPPFLAEGSLLSIRKRQDNFIPKQTLTVKEYLGNQFEWIERR